MVIEQISQMKQQGVPTNQIIQNLKQQGVSPKEINEAMSQSEIKTEITNNQGIFPGTPQTSAQQPPAQPNTGAQPTPATQEGGGLSVQQTPSTAQMQPSIGQQPAATQDPTTMNTQQPGMEMGTAPQMSQQGFSEPATQDYSQYQEYAPEGDEGYYPEYQQPGGADIETINDISSQIIDEKTKHFKKEFSEFTSYKKESHNKIDQLDQRLTKIEDQIEELKMAIIRKIGEYSEDVKNLSAEMKATQDSFGKIITPLTTKAKQAQATQPSTQDQPTKETKSKTQKTNKSDSFEDYLR